MSTKTDGKGSEETGATGPANVTSENAPSQTQDAAVGGAGMGTASPDDKKDDAKDKEEGDPVSVAKGTVVEHVVDVALHGLVPFRFVRRYSSADSAKSTPLGRGGWTHDHHQWIEPEGDGWLLRNYDGADLRFGAVTEGAAAFHRGRRLVLRRRGPALEVLEVVSRTTRVYEAHSPGGALWLRSIADGYGNRLVFHYKDRSLARVTDTAGREITFCLDDAQRIVAIDVTSAAEPRAEKAAFTRRLATFGYTPDGELAFAADASGHAYRYEYDGGHRLVRKQLKDGYSIHYRHDPTHGRVVRTWGDGGYHTVELLYDFEKRTTTTHSGPEPRVYHWDAHGNILKEETFDGRYSVEQKWDDDHLLLSEKNAAGEEHTYEYDARGFLTKHTDPAGNVTRYEHVDDLLRRVIRPNGNVRTYEYDGYGGLWSVTLETGARYSVDRDGRGRIVATYGPSGLLQRAEYDARHDLCRIIDAGGGSTTYDHDDLGRPVRRTDALGRTTTLEYDAAGWVTGMTLPDGSRQAFEYSPSGKLTRLSKAGGDVALEYVATGSLARVVLEDGSEWHLEYDREEKPVVVRNPRGERYSLAYDRAGRVVEERTFDGRVLRYGYDRADRLRRLDLPGGAYRELDHDPLGNIVRESSPHGDIEYTRSPEGWLLEATLTEGPVVSRVRFERDAYGRVVAEEQDGQTIRYEHGEGGAVVSRRLPSGEVTRFHHDLSGRPAAIEHAGARVTLGRDALGRETSRFVEGSSSRIVSGYDALGRLSTQRSVAPPSRPGEAAAARIDRRYSYDDVGRPSRIEDARWGATDYFYDRVHNLVRAQRGSLDEAFEYDPAGALLKAFAGLGSSGEAWTSRPGGVLVRTERAVYEVDACHRRTRKTEIAAGGRAERSTEYVWDCRDRLREVRLPDGRVVRYFYDAFCRRTRKVVFPAPSGPGSEPPLPRVTRYLWDGDVLAAEIDSEGGQRVFVHEPGTFKPILQSEQGEVFLYVLDHLGTPRELVDSEGRVAWAASYTAWGRVHEVQRDAPKRARPVESPFRLLGHFADEETGLHCTRFRYWDPEVARWLGPDPLGLWGGRRLFSLDGAPTVIRDPLGLTDGPNVLNIGAGPNPMPGATNIDLNPGHPSVQKMDANAMTFPDNHFDQVHAINPYGFNPVSDEVARVMKPGAELVISVNADKNPFTPGKKKAPVSSDLELVSGPSPLTDEHKFAKMKRADGGDVNEDAVKTFVFRKKKPGEAKSAAKKGKGG